MSKGNTTSNAVVNGGTRQTQMHMHHMSQEAKREMWAELVKRKEEAKKPKKSKMVPLDNFYKGISYKTAKGLTAFYIAASGKKFNRKTVKDNYDVNQSTIDRYTAWFANGAFTGNQDRISNFVLINRMTLLEAIMKAPAPTAKEVKRLYGICNPEYFNIRAGKVYKPNRTKEDHSEDYDHMLTKDQKVELMDLANLELAEVKPVTKSDVVTGVITGALIGAAMTAYLFMSNGAI